MQVILSALNLVAILSALVVAHELGHFLVAKWCGMRVEDFSLFFGPRLWRIGKFQGTEYNIRSIPLGGYVKIAGMEPDDLILGAPLLRPSLSNGKPVVMFGLSEEDIAGLDGAKIGDRVRAITETAIVEGDQRRLSPEGRAELKQLQLSTNITEEEHKYIDILLKADKYEPDPRAYNQRPMWQRAATIAAGPAASLLFGLLVFVVMGFTTGMPEARFENTIYKVADSASPAGRAGLRPGDRIVQIDDTPIKDGIGMVAIIHTSAGKLLTLQVQRGASTLTMKVTPELSKSPMRVEENGKFVMKAVGLIGFIPNNTYVFRRYSPVGAVEHGVDAFVQQVSLMVGAIFSKDVAKNTGGIIKIGAIVHEESKAGIGHLLLTAASLSLSLGICNLFPIPVLDGGHLLLLAWEGIRRRKLTSREMMTAQVCGLSIIGVLFVLITFKDFMQEILPRLVKHG